MTLKRALIFLAGFLFIPSVFLIEYLISQYLIATKIAFIIAFFLLFSAMGGVALMIWGKDD